VRTISYLLYPPMLEEVGLKSAIPWYLDGFSHRSGIKTTFEFSSDFGRLGRDAELALFRVLQEALTNVHRHSGSATADIQLARRDGVVIMEIRDHGKGAPPEVLQQSGSSWKASWGVGLRGMEERLRQLGGQLDVLTSEKGTVVRATIPIKESSPADTELDKEVGQGSSAGRSSC
jgi:signal transduction histidine kinase